MPSKDLSDCRIAPHIMPYKVNQIPMFALLTKTQCKIFHHSSHVY